MKSKTKSIPSWDILLKEVKKSNFLEKMEMEAIRLIESDTKVHLKEIGNSSYQLLVYAGYADSRKSVIDNNRDSLHRQLSNPGSVI